MKLSTWRVCLGAVLLVLLGALAPQALAADAIEFTQETLPNGLQVVYAPLHQAPVVHVRVLYHVGSRNERPDRQGFAHMFEHMMFRGSAHVKPEEHMKLIGTIGGYCNAFTSFDQTVYVNTVPANQIELPLYLEADRMASFKVSDDIFKTERQVVGEEYRMRANQPYGQIYDEILKAAFSTHSYQWTPIGNMRHLQAASSAELQDFFNHYYLPNNAILVIAGDFDLAATQAMVKRYFAWIPRGPDVNQSVGTEPVQTAGRRSELVRRVPLPMVLLGWHVPAYRSTDQPALALLSTIMAGGRSSRLERLLVSSADPLSADVSMDMERNQDPTLATIDSIVLAGKDPDVVEKMILAAVAEVCDKGVTAEELATAKMEHRVGLIRGRETAEQLATQLGTEALLGGDPGRVNAMLPDLDAVTRDDIQRVARQYFTPENLTILRVKPGSAAATPQEAAATAPGPVALTMAAAKTVNFPADWPTKPPISDKQLAAKFNKGVESTIGGVRVIVLEDHRVPIINFTLIMRGGSNSEPIGKDGLGGLTASLVRRGAGALSFAELNKELESKAISLEVGDGGDTTSLSGSCITDQLDLTVTRAADLLHRPTMNADEFAKLKTQELNDLRVALDSPTTVAGRDLATALYGISPLGRAATPATIAGITLDDVLGYHRSVYQLAGAILLISGDVTAERGNQMATQLLEGSAQGTPPVAEYPAAPIPAKRRIILVDRPEGKQATIRMGIPAYDNHADQKYAGILAGQILSAGIDSRLGKYVRAQKGLAYSVTGSFSPGRHGGGFYAGTDTAVPTTAAAIEAMFKVFGDMRDDLVTDQELAQAKTRVIGGMVMGMQTAGQQGSYRAQAILNDYPADYYDNYPAHLDTVTTQQVRDVMKQYVLDDRMVVVVVAPASVVKEQLDKLGDVEVVPMPASRAAAATQAAGDGAK